MLLKILPLAARSLWRYSALTLIRISDINLGPSPGDDLSNKHTIKLWVSQLSRYFGTWDYLGRQVAALSPPPRSLGELEQILLRVWTLLPISVTDNLIDSMEIRWLKCILARGGHIPY
ncbi:DDE_3 domain-containing protein [Trichonephila clavipes]|nr:DDE_3 domain-containing protein [Trichonephila clavipes]